MRLAELEFVCKSLLLLFDFCRVGSLVFWPGWARALFSADDGQWQSDGVATANPKWAVAANSFSIRLSAFVSGSS